PSPAPTVTTSSVSLTKSSHRRPAGSVHKPQLNPRCNQFRSTFFPDREARTSSHYVTWGPVDSVVRRAGRCRARDRLECFPDLFLDLFAELQWCGDLMERF